MFDIFMYIAIVTIGTFITSFFILIGHRVPRNVGINGRSQCDHCEKVIPWYGLIPILGYLILRGKCRYCKATISVMYPLVEFLGGLLFALSYLYLQDNVVEYVIAMVFFSLMIIVSVSDVKHQVVPDKILLVFLPVVLVLRMFFPLTTWYFSLLGGIAGFGFMWFMAWYGRYRFKKEALGGGDIKLYFLIGLFLELSLVFVSLFFASLLGLVFGKLVMKKVNPIPFVPFIFAGVLLAYFIGPALMTWYVGLFN